MGTHTGFYSTNEETFVVEKDLIKDGQQFKMATGEICEKVTESNYVFDVTETNREKVRCWVESETAVVPTGA